MKNKKMIKLSIFIMIIITIILVIFYVKDNRLDDGEKLFRYQFVLYNNKKSLDNIKYLTVNIEEDNDVIYLNDKNIIKKLKKETGIFLFCYPQSNSCRNVVNVLSELNISSGICKYYYNAYRIRDEKYIDNDGKIITIKKSYDPYDEILSILGDNAEEYYGLDDSNIKRLYFPTVLFVKNGKIKYMHSGTIDTAKEEKTLTKKEKNELKEIYLKGINKINK